MPKTIQIASDVTVDEFNSLNTRTTVGSPGEERLLTLQVSLGDTPANYNAVGLDFGLVYDGITDATLE
ncbi:hypothetical protein [Lysinibacter cavernae]|uniref:hypothetical protein n=1 Tax=Lysinibacter cavernae TaxID=1640652 RepID=UPI00361F82CF